MSVLSDRSNSSSSGPSGNGVGLSNPQLAQGRRSMLDLVNRLHSTGSVCLSFLLTRLIFLLVQCSVQVDIDLPQIAVIGSQSAGKSSLIESISGITLPRAAGTCTRYVFLLFFCIDLLTHTSQLLVVLQSADSHDPTPLGNVLFPSGSSPTHRGNY